MSAPFQKQVVLVCGAVLILLSRVFAIIQDASNEPTIITLENPQVVCTIVLQGDQLVSDRLQAKSAWFRQWNSAAPAAVETDADFALDVMWSDWRAPGKQNNADNPVILSKKNFAFVKKESLGPQEISLYFKGIDQPLLVRLTYSLDMDAFYLRRKIAACDTIFGHHFLRWFWPRQGQVADVQSIMNQGAFGQPVALSMKEGGVFFGLEYPASENRFLQNGLLRCGQEIGEKITKNWIESEWVVQGLVPNNHIKYWFMKYVDEIRIAKLRPYTLYNSWYDLRSPEYPKVPPENIMNEESSHKMIEILRKNMVEKHNIHLDAFVLDDGWDVYKSDWVLRPVQFPNGLKPLTSELQKMGTNLGIWIGPIGGYSFREWRIEWMKEHGYEVIGDQFCVAGEKYHALLKQRVTELARNEGVNYFKWDGIQFSCSEKDHGHPIDVYSRRAVVEAVIDLCKTAREKNPGMFLNITSGSWLSPWWVKYANTIWMDGQDYGYADVPSISQRDGAITYRDFVLYEDFKIKGLWFPIANLMTHGIIKGKLEMLGSPEEPLDKFTDDVLLYFARGVSMYELYISPDILSDGEWNSVSSCIAWAKDRFPVLSTVEMIGGNPMKRETYGYAHFKDDRGIIAARNPFIPPGSLTVELAAAQGLNPNAKDLVLERIYPTRYISPELYRTGDEIILPLDGYETAVYELYPLKSAKKPLLAGVSFEVISQKEADSELRCFDGGEDIRFLNPESVRSICIEKQSVPVNAFRLKTEQAPDPVSGFKVQTVVSGNDIQLQIPYTLSPSCSDAMLAVLLSPKKLIEKDKISLSGQLDGSEIKVKTEFQEGHSQWYTLAAPIGKHEVMIQVMAGADAFQGQIQVWMIAQQKQPTKLIALKGKNKAQSEILPPRPWQPGSIRTNVLLGEVEL